MLELIILVLAVLWLLNFFGQSVFPLALDTAGFIDMAAIFIVVLISVQFLAWL